MKKLLTLLLTLLMIFTLVGCNSKQEETIKVDEPVQQEKVVEKEEVIVEQEEEIKEEVKEEVKEEKKVVSNKDITNMSFWIVTFDQYGNEVDRYTAKYGSVVYDPSNGKAVTVKGNTKFYVTIDDTPSGGGSSSGGGGGGGSNPPGPACEHIGEDLYYFITKAEAMPGSGMHVFALYKYTYDNVNNKYVFNSTFAATDSEALVPVIGATLVTELNNYAIGDFIHGSPGNFEKCNYGGDGITFYTLNVVTDGNGFVDPSVPSTTYIPKGIDGLKYECGVSSTGGTYQVKLTAANFLLNIPITPNNGYELDYFEDGTNQDVYIFEDFTSNMTITVHFKPE